MNMWLMDNRNAILHIVTVMCKIYVSMMSQTELTVTYQVRRKS